MDPTIEHFEAAGSFLDAVEPFLMEAEAVHCLLLGLAQRLRDRPAADSPPDMAVVRERARPVLASLRTPPRNLVLSELAPGADPRAVSRLVDDLAAQCPDLPGVLGPAPVASAFAEAWTKALGKTSRVLMRERVYELIRVEAPAAPAGRMRLVGADDAPSVRDWIAAFAREATPEEPDPEGVADHLFRARIPANRARGLAVWERDGRRLSLVGWTGETPTGIRIGPVYTPPENRCHGYAGALTAAVSRSLLALGRQRCFLFADLANPTSNHIYQAVGYRPVGDQDFYGFA